MHHRQPPTAKDICAYLCEHFQFWRVFKNNNQIQSPQPLRITHFCFVLFHSCLRWRRRQEDFFLLVSLTRNTKCDILRCTQCPPYSCNIWNSSRGAMHCEPSLEKKNIIKYVKLKRKTNELNNKDGTKEKWEFPLNTNRSWAMAPAANPYPHSTQHRRRFCAS